MSEQNLNDWLQDIKVGKLGIVDYSVPSDKLKSDYVATIEQRADSEITLLLRKFLISSGSLGSDQFTFSWLVHSLKEQKLRRLSEFQKRLIIYAKAKVASTQGAPPPWEGVTWVLDLLPDNPRAAIDTLNAYFEAHCLFMPDGRMHGIADATELIRAKYIQRP